MDGLFSFRMEVQTEKCQAAGDQPKAASSRPVLIALPGFSSSEAGLLLAGSRQLAAGGWQLGCSQLQFPELLEEPFV